MPPQPMDLYSDSNTIPRVGEKSVTLEDIHSWVQKNIGEANAKYKEGADKSRRELNFEGDFVMVHLMTGIFPTRSYSKIKE